MSEKNATAERAPSPDTNLLDDASLAALAEVWAVASEHWRDARTAFDRLKARATLGESISHEEIGAAHQRSVDMCTQLTACERAVLREAGKRIAARNALRAA